jgi:hypothetical protein
MKRSALIRVIRGKFLPLLLILATTAHGSVTVTGHVKIGDTTTPAANVVRVRFELIRCTVAGQNTPRVIGVTNFKPLFDVTTFDGTGAFSVTTYGNDVITCDQAGNSRWKVTQIFSDGTSQYNVYQFTDGVAAPLDSLATDNSAAVAYQPNAVLTNPSGAQDVTQPGSTALTIHGNFGVTGTCTGCGTTITTQTNGVNNSSQTTLNVQNGTGTTATNPSAGNVQVAVNYGSTGGTAAQGNDSRIVGAEQTANKNQASGYAGLDGSSKLTGSQQVYGTIANTATQGNDSRVTGAEQTANKDQASGYAGLDSGTKLKCAEHPALTGGVTSSAGSCVTTLRALTPSDVPDLTGGTGSQYGFWSPHMSFPWFTAGGNQVIVTTGGDVRTMQVVVPYAFTVKHVSIQVQTLNNPGTADFGMYSVDGTTRLFHASFDTSTTGTKTTTLAAAVLIPAGTYWFAWTCDNGVAQVYGFTTAGQPGSVFVNSALKAGRGTSSSGGLLNTSLGTVSGSGFNALPVVLLEP